MLKTILKALATAAAIAVALFVAVPIAHALPAVLVAGSALSAENPTLIDLAKRLDPNGKIANIVEVLAQTNEVLDDMTVIEGNLPTGHKSVIRTGYPTPTWRKLYGTVTPGKSTTAEVTDTCGMLEQYAKVDKALADLNGNAAAWRFSEDKAFINAMNNEVSQTLFYGNQGTEPEAFTGLSPRFSALSGYATSDNVIDGGSNDTDNTSIWLVVWGPDTVHGIIPQGSQAGLQVEDKGQMTVQESTGMWEAYVTHYRWDIGLCVRDWRYIVRIANIELSDITKNAATGADLFDLISQALELVPNLRAGRPVLYCNRTIKSWLRRQAKFGVASSTLTVDQMAGRRVMFIDEVPVRRCDALVNTETRLT